MKKKVLIIAIVLLLIVLGAVGGYFGYKYWESNQSVGTDWGDVYYEYLQDGISQGEFLNSLNGKLQFIQLEENKTPAMVVSYDEPDKKVMRISVINADNVVREKEFEAESNSELSINYLYDIETQEYNWYEHEKKQDGTELFTGVTQSDVEEMTSTSEKHTEFKPEDMIEKEQPSISKFNEKYIEPETNKKEVDVELNLEDNKKDFKEKVKEAVKDFQENNQSQTESSKDQTEQKLEELNTKKEEIKKAEEEAKQKAEEEAAKKAAEEAAKGISAGSYNLKYGTYVSTTIGHEEFILNQDGTFSYKGPNGSGTGTYQVSRETYMNSAVEETDWLIKFKASNTNIWNANTDYIINKNNGFMGIQDGGIFSHQGN